MSVTPPWAAQSQEFEKLTLPLSSTSIRFWSCRALDLPDHHLAFIADPHFGKSATFRGLGLPAPETAESDLQRLSLFLKSCNARHLIILGDFYHARRGRTESIDAALQCWRNNHPELAITLVRGNHDQAAGDPPASLQIQSVPEPYSFLPDFRACHFPQNKPEAMTLAGHLHPGLNLRARQGGSLTAACFWIQPQQIVLPAFGSFTGMECIQPAKEDRCILISSNDLVELSSFKTK